MGKTIDTEILHSSVFRTSTSKLVFFYLLRDSDEAGVVNTSAVSIAKEIGVNEKTVRKVFKSFRDNGVIEIKSPISSPISSPILSPILE